MSKDCYDNLLATARVLAATDPESLYEMHELNLVMIRKNPWNQNWVRRELVTRVALEELEKAVLANAGVVIR